ncbi:thioesterase-like superfamily-domain-containing protein [Parachaetomium inaequale]|uniref:Thioesterase-like superfamily-domain-containing protein n=1 Tax=Parachaetomium inaequale TaxID=2588326 RepID=A0AAN6PIX7_9PEZI|nr:thioesterase-like superfamily-domain-containing protein [Parachaetomium inaequale]
MALDGVPPLPLQEALHLVKLPSAGEARRFMGTRAAYLPGSDFTADSGMPNTHTAAFGGHVYAQAALAAARAWRELEDEKGAKPGERLDLHTIHGYFTRPGIPTRPFLYTVTPLTASRTFATLSITAHQPSQPSTNPQGDHFPLADATLLPLSPPAFTAICSLKRPEPDSHSVSTQEPPPQQRFAAILSTRAPSAWPPAPPIDITGIVEQAGADQPGKFPVATMRKVDMTAYNEGRPVHERRELLLYRLIKPLPPSEDGEEEDANAHVAAHTYVADRNGLLMAGNHIGFGHSFGRAASLSYSFVVHVNAAEAVMRDGEGDDKEGWWVQEMWFPRAARGRGIVESKIWSPRGVHVATEYQDGLVQGLGVGKL